jgi:Uma2 family endonuclease
MPHFVTVRKYLNTSYQDGDREYLDGVVVKRNLGTIAHSLLQGIVGVGFNILMDPVDRLMDPVDRTTYMYRSGILIRQELKQLQIAPESIPFDTEALYAEMDR